MPTGRPTVSAIVSNGTPNTSCSTNATRSPGLSLRKTSSQRGADLVVEGDPIGRVRVRDSATTVSARIVRLAQPLVARSRRTHLIKAEPAGDHGQPAADIVDLVGIDPRQPQKCFLRNVFGVADIAEYLISEIDQIGAVTTPGLGDLVAWRLRSGS